MFYLFKGASMRFLTLFTLCMQLLLAVVLNFKEHNAMLTDIQVKNNLILSSSRDGLGFLWDKNFNKLARLREDREINSIDFSNNFIAYSGRLGKRFNSIKIAKIDKGFYKELPIGPVVSRVRFFEHYLVATTLQGIVVTYDVDKNFTKVAEVSVGSSRFNSYKNYLYDIDYVGNNKVVFVSWSGDIYLYDIANDEIITKNHVNTKLQAVVKLKDSIIASGYDRKLYIFDLNLKKKGSIDIGQKALSLAKSKDESLLLIPPFGYNTKVYIYKDLKPFKSFTVKDFEKESVCFSLASSFFNKNEFLFNCSDKIYFGFLNENKIFQLAQSSLIKSTDIAIDKNKIYFKNSNKTPISFSLETLEEKFEIYFPKKEYQSPLGDYFKLSSTYHYNDTLSIYNKFGEKIGEDIKDASNGYSHKSVIFMDEYILSGGSNGEVRVYDRYSNIIATLTTKENSIRAIGFNKELIAVVDTQGEVFLFNRAKIETTSLLNPFISLVFFRDGDFVVQTKEFYYANNKKRVYQGIFNKNKIKEVLAKKDDTRFIDLRANSFPSNFKEANFYYLSSSEDEQYLAFWDEEYLKIVDIASNKIIQAYKIPGIKALSFTKDYLYIGLSGGNMLKISLKNFKIVKRYTLEGDFFDDIRKIFPINDKLYVIKEKEHKSKSLHIYTNYFSKIKKINLGDLDGFISYFNKKFFLVDDISLISKYDSSSGALLQTLENRDYVDFYNNLLYTTEGKKRIKIYDSNFSFLEKIDINNSMFISGGKATKEAIYLYGFDGLIKVDKKAKKVTKTIPFEKDEISFGKKNIYIATKEEPYKIKIYDYNLSFQKDINFSDSAIKAFALFKEYKAIAHTKSIKLYKNDKLIKNFSLKNKKLEFFTLKGDYLVFSSYFFGKSDIILYDIKKNKIIKREIAPFQHIAFSGKKIFIASSKKIDIFNTQLEKIDTLPIQNYTIFYSDALYVQKDSALYKLENKKLKKLLSLYQYGFVRGDKAIYSSNDTIKVKNKTKEELFFNEDIFIHFLIKNDYIIGATKHKLFIWDKNLKRKSYLITNNQDTITALAMQGKKLFVTTYFGRVIPIELKR